MGGVPIIVPRKGIMIGGFVLSSIQVLKPMSKKNKSVENSKKTEIKALKKKTDSISKSGGYCYECL